MRDASEQTTEFYLPENISKYQELYNLSLQYKNGFRNQDAKICFKLIDQMWDILDVYRPIEGTWSYEEGSQILTMDVFASGFGQQHHEVVRITTTGQENYLQGKDLAGRDYSLYRES